MPYDKDFADLSAWLVAHGWKIHIPMRGAPYLSDARTGAFVRSF